VRLSWQAKVCRTLWLYSMGGSLGILAMSYEKQMEVEQTEVRHNLACLNHMQPSLGKTVTSKKKSGSRRKVTKRLVSNS
jgi:hypothetical protein